MHVEYISEFVMLAQTLNFTAAAKHLHISQPALSNHIASLEKELGVRLFERDSQQVRLSPVGRAWLDDARACMMSYEDAIASIRRIKSHESISVTVMTHMTHRYVADLFRTVQAELESANPSFELKTVELLQADPVWEELGKSVDLSFFLHHHHIDKPGFIVEDISEDPLVAIVPKDSPFARSQSLSIKDFEGTTIYLPRALESNVYMNSIRALFSECGVDASFQGCSGRSMDEVYQLNIASGAFIDSKNASESLPGPLRLRYEIIPIIDENVQVWDAVAYPENPENKGTMLVVEELKKLVRPIS